MRALPAAVRWTLALAVAGVWWWAVLRLALSPARAGAVEAAVAAGGWGLGLLPVHCAAPGAAEGRRSRRAGGGRGGEAGTPLGGDAGVSRHRGRGTVHGYGPGWQRGHQ
ncbi:hypothetical protein [Streptomyces xinghaiensis]|uniref:hypothetical protein n=1 Tax=Streptomyces xinghaiensis TaxID=1038928 RepID=UPI001EDD8CE5|nr:hypothetical protein [Streptomyces xinghaiensis]